MGHVHQGNGIRPDGVLPIFQSLGASLAYIARHALSELHARYTIRTPNKVTKVVNPKSLQKTIGSLNRTGPSKKHSKISNLFPGYGTPSSKKN